jgi:hypothetical protein
MTEQNANKFICPVCLCSIITSREITEQTYCIQCARDRPNEALLWVANKKIQKLQAQLASAREVIKKCADAFYTMEPVVNASVEKVTDLEDFASSVAEFGLTREQREWINKVYEAASVIEDVLANKWLKENGEA